MLLSGFHDQVQSRLLGLYFFSFGGRKQELKTQTMHIQGFLKYLGKVTLQVAKPAAAQQSKILKGLYE